LQGWAIGVDGAIVTTGDGGRTWRVEAPPAPGRFFGPFVRAGNTLIARQGVGNFPPGERFLLYRRVAEPTAKPPLVPPATGSGPPGRAAEAPAALFLSGLTLLAFAYARARAPTRHNAGGCSPTPSGISLRSP
jgi:hypothetical protein